MKKYKLTLLDDAVALWGIEERMDMLVEECAELIVAVNHFKRNRITQDQLISELADVEIMLDQMRIIFNENGNIDSAKEGKLERLQETVNRYTHKKGTRI